MEGKKLRSLLKFYKKNKIEIELGVNIRDGLVIGGTIVKLNCIMGKYFVLKSKDNSLIKVFLEDIVENSILPLGFIKSNNEKDKKKEMNRSSISPKLRFEVFRRDKFVCQYCGACGPNVELEVDHKIPVSRGGKDDIDNLVTSCIKCNRGKGDRV